MTNTYDQLVHRNLINVVRRACYKTPALIEFDSLPTRFKDAVIEKYGDPRKGCLNTGLRSLYVQDARALDFYSSFRLPDGKTLDKKIPEYVTNASLLKAIHALANDRKALRKALGNSTKKTWESISNEVNGMVDEYHHTLPSNPRRLKSKMEEFISGGYGVLISGKYGNQNTRKVSTRIEKLILSLYTMPEKPYTSTVHELYLQFLGGAIEVCDTKTGEIYDPKEFYDKEDQPIMLSEATIWNYINDPKNRVLVDKRRTGGLEFDNIHRPHHHRHSPIYTFSKISLDDRDLPRKMHGGTRVKAYYAYDVTSGAVIGRAYSKLKTTDLFIDCVRDMFRNIFSNGLKMPAEMEVEHHLVNTFADGLFKAGIVFPFVRWCNPGNSKEKRAEHFNKAKKYEVEKTEHIGIGRWYAKLEANRPKVDKVFDEFNNTYKEKTFSYEQLVAEDKSDIEKYNNSLHPKQKLYPGMTRWQVLMEEQNPNLANIDKVILTKYLGEKTHTSIRRSQYVTVQYEKYQLSSPQILERLNPNSYEVDAYYLPDQDGNIPTVYLWQNDEFICECNKIVTYNESTFEQTEADHEAYVEQAKYVSRFDKMSKEDKPERVKVLKKTTQEIIAQATAEVVETITESDEPDEDYLLDYSPEKMKQRALSVL
jgi:hypothetical protein